MSQAQGNLLTLIREGTDVFAANRIVAVNRNESIDRCVNKWTNDTVLMSLIGPMGV